MGNPKQKWTSEEEEALRAGVAKHGVGKWKTIENDPEFKPIIYSRSNIDLKDKWRNLSVANGQGPRDKSKTPKAKTNPAEAPATPLTLAPTLASVTPSSQDASTDVVVSDSSRPLPENNAAKCNSMIYEALANLNEPNGSDISAIVNYIEQRHEVPQSFRRWLSTRLRKLVQQDKLEKVQNCYRVKRDVLVDTKAPFARPIDSRPRDEKSIERLGNTVEEASISAAYNIVEAENKAHVAAESVKESERVSTMAEEMESLLQFAMDCYDQSALGDIMLMS